MDSLALRDALARLAGNHRWTWDPALRSVWSDLDGGTLDQHPVSIVNGLASEELDRLLSDRDFIDTIAAATERLDYLDETAPAPEIAYFSPEFGLSDVVPQYSGGLGILAGDHLKSSSDLAVPLVGVGLFYREGFFRQSIEGGNQAESYPVVTPEGLGANPTGVTVEVPLPGRNVRAAVWEMHVGRTRLLLLDTDVEANHAEDRRITDRLYSGDRVHRLEQELVLGVGGTRALAAVGLDIAVYHLNEGHAGFLVLELIDRVIEDGDLAAAVDAIRPGLVFTTHTPVPAGIDRFEAATIAPYLEVWAARWGVPLASLWELGADPVDSKIRFNMAALGLRLSSAANGVSRLHGQVSRELFAGVGIGDDITHVTNGVHARTWVAGHTQNLFDRNLGEGWENGSSEAWGRVGSIDDATLLAERRTGSENLARLVAATTGHTMDPDALVIGFARRFATYKRANLMFHHMDRLVELLADDDQPVHFVFAGKAHPADEPGKRLLAEIVHFANSPRANGRFTFIPDYAIEIARNMYDGCDVWLNTPVRPREASGTSGEKSALNGGLNCSILDGWWAEMYDGENGWAIPTSDDTDPAFRDRVESAATLDTLEAVIAEYFGHRSRWVTRIRHNWQSLGPKVTSGRMLGDYVDEIYGPAIRRVR